MKYLVLIWVFVVGYFYRGMAQTYISTDTIGQKTVSDNIYNKPLFGDSLSNSFVIVIRKVVKAHKHLKHTEHIVVLDGNGTMKLGDKSFDIKKGDMIFIPKGTVHSVISTGKNPLKVVSVQSPNFDGNDRVFID